MKKTILFVVLAVASPVAAEQSSSPSNYPDFTFKMGKPPAPGSTPRITVRIQPDDHAPQVDRDIPAATPAPPETTRYDWFWQAVPAGYVENSASRLDDALSLLRDPSSAARVQSPRLQNLQRIAQSQGAEILRSTIGTSVSPALVLAVIFVESGGRADAVSIAGAEGLMQLIPATAERFDVKDTLSAAENIKGGVAYLEWLLREFDGDPILALAGYNAGENAVKRHEGVPPFVETRGYVPKVLAAYEVAKGLCKTRPQLISDGCAFNLAAN